MLIEAGAKVDALEYVSYHCVPTTVDRRCILIGLSVRVTLDPVDVVCFPVCKCMHNPNDVAIVLPGCLDGMIGGNVDDWTCDQGRSWTFDQEVAAVVISSRSRRIC